MSYPEYANIDGTRYKINTDFKVALRCFKIINDVDIQGEERTLAIIYILFGFVPEFDLLQKFLDKAVLFLQCGKTSQEQNSHKRDMDFEYDSAYIGASFMSDYHIDINSVDMHWWQFCDLISGLTEHCVLSRVREIRNYDLSDIKDEKTRSKILQAKEELSIPVRRTKEEQAEIDEFERLFGGG